MVFHIGTIILVYSGYESLSYTYEYKYCAVAFAIYDLWFRSAWLHIKAENAKTLHKIADNKVSMFASYKIG